MINLFKFEYIVFIFALVVTYFGVGRFRAWSLRKGYLDHPNERSSHETPTPRGGGLVIAAVTISSYIGSSWPLNYKLSIGFIIGAVLVVAVSWLDDIYSISFAWRLIVHLLAATAVIVDVGYFDSVAFPFVETPLDVGIFGILISIIWIAWFVNAYNFMDGIDGIAGVQAVAAGLGWLLVGQLTGIPAATIIGGTVLFSSIGFLIHNWQPAKIFMGDAGSAFLGFTLASMPFLVREQGILRPALLPVVAVLFVWLFVFDSALTLVRRLIRGERVWTAHQEHLYQRMVIGGRSHQFVSTLYGVVAVVIAVPAALLVDHHDSSTSYILVAIALFSMIMLIAVAYRTRPSIKKL